MSLHGGLRQGIFPQQSCGSDRENYEGSALMRLGFGCSFSGPFWGHTIDVMYK
jgi:hypothetical protein